MGVRDIPIFTQSDRHVLSPELSKRLVRELKQEYPLKDIYLTVSSEPKPNLYVAALAPELGFKMVGYFRSVLWGPMAFVDGFRWIRLAKRYLSTALG